MQLIRPFISANAFDEVANDRRDLRKGAPSGAVRRKLLYFKDVDKESVKEELKETKKQEIDK